MPLFLVEIYHNDKTFEALAHMQYDLFCKSNRIGRTIISIAAILAGIVNSENWWGILLIAYGCYLTTSTYASANYTAHKLSKQIQSSGMDFPASRYEFTENGMRIISLPDYKISETLISYDSFLKLGEDRSYLYLFPNTQGGYMIPKAELSDEDGFKQFIRRRTGKSFYSRIPPVAKLLQKLKDREQEPYHL